MPQWHGTITSAHQDSINVYEFQISNDFCCSFVDIGSEVWKKSEEKILRKANFYLNKDHLSKQETVG